jgi:hypothetical protein
MLNLISLISVFVLTYPVNALAYMGPGAGTTLIGALWAVIIAVVLMMGGLLVWPIRAFWRRLKRGRFFMPLFTSAGQSHTGESWDVKLVSLLVYVLPRRQAEEWLGDLRESRRVLRDQGWPQWVLALVTIGRAALLIWSLMRIKYEDIRPGTTDLTEVPALAKIWQVITKAALSRANVAITGGTRRQAQAIGRKMHKLGPQRNCPFLVVNCGGSEEVIERSIFARPTEMTGRPSFRLEGGTIFFSRAERLSLQTQVKILMASQGRPNVRLIASSSDDLAAAVYRGKFREDLYYRLNVIQIPLPRQDD